MASPKQKQLKLPKALINELGGEDVLSSGRKNRNSQGSRKESRKAARGEKKAARHEPSPAKRAKTQHVRAALDEESDSDSEEPSHHKKVTPKAMADESPRPQSILKPAKKLEPKSKESQPRMPRLESPPRISKSVKAKLDEDDDEIAALEKKLGLKGKKGLPQAFKDDGLDELLEGLDDSEDDEQVETKSRKAEGDEWLEKKRRDARQANSARTIPRAQNDICTDEDEDEYSNGLDEVEGSDKDGASDMSLDGPDFPDDVSEEDGLNEEDELDTPDGFSGFSSDDDEVNEVEPARKHIRENPYIAPGTGTRTTEKYIPPSLRKATASDSEDLTRLRRRTQGLINRLTEANLVSILGDVEGLYRTNPRQHVTSILVDILLTSVCEPTSLPDTLIILPAGFIATVYKIIGTDFGAQVIQQIVELFDEHYSRATALLQEGPESSSTDISKETSNLIMLLCEMYNFQVVSSNIIFDFVKIFLEQLSELNAELLLKIIRASGPQLRRDDSSSLKDIVSMIRPAVENAGGEANISVRTKFMIETITDLKNNKMKIGSAASAVTSEHTIRMKRIIGSLNSRTIKGGEPLRIGLGDIRELHNKGKWWLVGASWAGDITDDIRDGAEVVAHKTPISTEDGGTSDLLQLAREQRMNTDVRRAIFVAIMSATDYQDAHVRLMKLKLKRVQEYEIPKVLIHCAGGEKSYNPYYTLISKKLCDDRRLRTAFQFCLWDLFKKMGETDEEVDADNDEEDSLSTRRLVNLAKLFGTLMLEGGLGLTVLKNLNLSYLQTKTKMFLEVLFITIFLQSQKHAESKRDDQPVVEIFTKIKETPHIIIGLQYFLRKVVSKTDIAGGNEEKAIVKWSCGVAKDTLEALAALD